MRTSWERFKNYLYMDSNLGLMVDISRMDFTPSFLTEMESSLKSVYQRIDEMEKGSIANPDENRRVGHYWLRNPDFAPTLEIQKEIQENLTHIDQFVEKIHSGELTSEKGRKFKNVLQIGIGGSSLGPRFVADALESPNDKMRRFFIDNTDPEGMDRIFNRLVPELDETLCLIVSKSGGTIETRNAMLELKALYQANNLSFSAHAIAITQFGSQLEKICQDEQWLSVFPMWDWIGGRTSVLSAVGLVVLGLQGINTKQILLGAKSCDERTRSHDTLENPAALLALMWYKATEGKGGKQMVILPYKDRLALFSKYLQQLIMESLGKERDLENRIVHQGIAVYGNKGSTDQHSYIQQLLDGPDNFFVMLIEVLKDRNGKSLILAENSTSGDYLHAFLLGTRDALTSKGRESITITIREVIPFTVGVLIALFERAVSIYALLVNINAYHQPAVEIGKRAAGDMILLKNRLLDFLGQHPKEKYTLEGLAEYLSASEKQETLFKLLLHLRENPEHGIQVEKDRSLFNDRYYIDPD